MILNLDEKLYKSCNIMTLDKVLLSWSSFIYLFVLVLAKEWKCNSGNYYQFTPRGN